MGLSGNLSTIGLPDVLQFLSTGGKTGMLLLTRGDDEAHVFFQDGKIIYTSSSTRKDSLLKILVRNDNLARDDAERIRKQSVSDSNSIENILRQGGFISDETLMEAALVQAQEIMYELFQWVDGDFQFMADEMPPDPTIDLTVSMGTFKLIMEGARRSDEWRRIRDVIPCLDTIFALDGELDPEKSQFNLEDLVILSMIDGNTPVRNICQRTGKTEFDLCRILYGYITAGLITVVSQEKADPTPDKGK